MGQKYNHSLIRAGSVPEDQCPMVLRLNEDRFVRVAPCGAYGPWQKVDTMRVIIPISVLLVVPLKSVFGKRCLVDAILLADRPKDHAVGRDEKNKRSRFRLRCLATSTALLDGC